MKQRDLIKRFENAGFKFERHGGNHDVYKRGTEEEQIPDTVKSMRNLRGAC